MKSSIFSQLKISNTPVFVETGSNGEYWPSPYSYDSLRRKQPYCKRILGFSRFQ